MKKYRLCLIRKQGKPYRHYTIRVGRDAVTGELSASFSGGGRMLMVCIERLIPELTGLVGQRR
ncbi:MAG: hypothetical protein IJJ42_07540 [Clostridia bacterium]|nr:hypothetical protein [Clostridia bacterium]